MVKKAQNGRLRETIEETITKGSLRSVVPAEDGKI